MTQIQAAQTVLPSGLHTRWDYAEQINEEWRKSVESSVEIGRLLSESKRELDHGEFEKMVDDDLPFGQRTAEMFIAIHHDPVLSNTNHGSLLPSSWRTLYALTRLPDDTKQQYLDEGIITPETQRKDVEKWLGNRDIGVLMSSQSNEWYTTQDIIDTVIDVMGGIDLDPCSNSHTNPSVPASHHFTKEDDGLAQKWFGRVYMNPPYGRAIPDWIGKLVEEYQAGRVQQAVALVPARPDTAWFRMMRDCIRCFMFGRVRFNDHENSAPFPTMLVGVGCARQRFIEVTKEIGDVYIRIDQ